MGQFLSEKLFATIFPSCRSPSSLPSPAAVSLFLSAMLSSTGGGGSEYEKSKFVDSVPSSSSSKLSSSASSSSSPSVPFSPSFLHRSKTMEETWKDITFSSLHDDNARDRDLSVNPGIHLPSPNPTSNFRSMIFQDFLARPLGKDSSACCMVSSARNAGNRGAGSPAPPPATMLSLNSNRGFHFLDGHESAGPTLLFPANPISNAASFTSPFDALASSGLLPFARKRFQEPENNSGDRRHKRMIKNRESAARSRARKQEYYLSAYTNELELEVAHLIAENARLKKQQEQLCQAAAAQAPKKHTLQRTSTAPF